MYHLFVPGAILEVDQKRTLTNGPTNKKTNGHSCGIASQILYVSGKGGGRGLASSEDTVDSSI